MLWLLTSLMIVSLLVVFSFHYLDRPVAIYFKQHNYPYTRFFSHLSELGNGAVVFTVTGVLALCYLILGDWKKLTRIFFIITSELVVGLLNTLIKILSGRFRPNMLFTEGNYGFDLLQTTYGGISFPSGHAATIMAAMAALSLLYPRWTFLFMTLGLVVSASRVVILSHYVSDVVFATYLAIVTTILIRRYFERCGFSLH